MPQPTAFSTNLPAKNHLIKLEVNHNYSKSKYFLGLNNEFNERH